MARQRVHSARAKIVTNEKGGFRATVRVYELKDGEVVKTTIENKSDDNVYHQEHITRHLIRSIRDPANNKVVVKDLHELFADPSAQATEFDRQTLHIKAVMPHPPPYPVITPPFRTPGVPRSPLYDAAVAKCEDEMIPLSAPPTVEFTNALPGLTRCFPTDEEISWDIY
ncbi:MAG: hypothetical protein LQ342_006312 [Letrouitia transgressa]|nr:MAG: hypothetical protein LQ342_006312 [Letrouitia transgressa]